jgi:hypothetical protein
MPGTARRGAPNEAESGEDPSERGLLRFLF